LGVPLFAGQILASDADGKRIWITAPKIEAYPREPQPDDGDEGQAWINTSSGDVFVKTAGLWELRGNLKGPIGKDGPPGEGLHVLGAFDTTAELPVSAEVGDAYIVDQSLWVWGANLQWNDTGIIVGPEGPPGVNALVNIDADEPINPAPGVFWLDPNTTIEFANLYELAQSTGFTGTLEQYIESIQGETGAQGPIGLQGETGETGAEGAQGTRGPQGVVGPRGPAGPDGPLGPNGPAGTQGEQGVQGEAGFVILGTLNNTGQLPSNASTGDGYIVGTNLWLFDGNQWQDLGDLQGPPGADGAVGPAGPNGADGPEGAASTVPGPAGAAGPEGAASTVPGPAGATGPVGPEGQGIRVQGALPAESSLPANADSFAGEAYLINGDLWIFSAVDGWQDVGNITGPEGPQGSPGPRGEQGAASTVPGPTGPTGPVGPQGRGLTIRGELAAESNLPSNANSFAGEAYFINGSMWVFSVADGWVDVGNLEGPQGPQGLAGPQGETGPQGSAGADADWTELTQDAYDGITPDPLILYIIKG
jgi:hypothetical protein